MADTRGSGSAMTEQINMALDAYAEIMNIPRTHVTLNSCVNTWGDFYLWALHYKVMLKNEQWEVPYLTMPHHFPCPLKKILPSP